MYPRLKDYFYFNKVERNGVISLVIILVTLLGINIWLSNQVSDNVIQESRLQEGIAFLDSIEQIENKKVKTSQSSKLNEKILLKPFQFNPNELQIDDFVSLGLSEKQAKTIINYRAKGGSFRVKSDFKKMYSISESIYNQLEQFILLPDTLEKYKAKKEKYSKSKKWVPPTVYLNKSDSSEFVKLRGIGPVFASRIIKYRNNLGGFHDLNQLSEVYGLSDSLVQTFGSQLIFDTVELKKLNINELNAKELKVNPYISWNIANSIVSIREQHGKYNKLEDIKKSVLINDSVFRKLKPYLYLK